MARRGVPSNLQHEVAHLVPLPSRLGTPVPRLRFDRVVLRLIADLRAALAGAVPDRTTALLTLAAPIRQPGKTAAAIEGIVRARIARASFRDLVTTLNGNHLRVRIVTHALVDAPTVIEFVHNPEPHPHRLLDCATEWLAVLGEASARRARTSGGRWLRVRGPGRRAFASVDHYVCSELLPVTSFSKIVLVDHGSGDDVLAG